MSAKQACFKATDQNEFDCHLLYLSPNTLKIRQISFYETVLARCASLACSDSVGDCEEAGPNLHDSAIRSG